MAFVIIFNGLKRQSIELNSRISVIIPAYNESDSIARVLRDIPSQLNASIIVVDNNSTDDTAGTALKEGAIVLTERSQGYGHACARGVQYLAGLEEKPGIVVFLDGDYSDYPEEMTGLVRPIIEEGYDLVVGCRTTIKSSAMPLQQLLGNWLATSLINLLYGKKYRDLGPFRAIRFEALAGLNIQDRTYGWPVEMQVKAARQNLRILEVPVCYRPRIGKSKISGTIKGTVLAGYKIISTILKYRR
jgi:glycosyltransferase involved in cell wall biosynthesis